MANTLPLGPASGGATASPAHTEGTAIMQDTSPAASQRPEPVTGHDAEGQARVEVTWFEDSVDQPVDAPLIALLPLPDSS
jgi:hypothetical protein